MSEFPTGKPHISYSEVKVWKECAWRHKLAYIDKLDVFEANVYSDFGSTVHEAIELYLKTKKVNIDLCNQNLKNLWKKRGYDSPSYIMLQSFDNKKYKHVYLQTWQEYAKNILDQLPTWMDETFPNWELIEAEHQLYEGIENASISFKGFVDCIIKVPKGKNGKFNYWVIDWKTTGPAGWFFKKKRDFLTLAQIGLYKYYWCNKNGIEYKDVRTGYVFLKRGAKAGNCLELFKVSAGPKFIEKTNKLVKSMIFSVNRSFFPKNRDSCRWCPFKQTEHCDGEW